MKVGNLMLGGPVGGAHPKMMEPKPNLFGDAMQQRRSVMLLRYQTLTFGPVEATFHRGRVGSIEPFIIPKLLPRT